MGGLIKAVALARRAAWLVVPAALALACACGPARAQEVKGPSAHLTPVTDAMLQRPSGADWLMYRRTYDAHGFSPLSQINTTNVKGLTLVWSRAMGPGPNEASALVHDGVMFLPNPGGLVQAIDAASGSLIWEYRRALPKGAFSSGQITRSIAIYGANIYYISPDNVLIALDAKTGKVRWERQREGKGVSNSTGPIVAAGVVVAGSNCDYAIPGGCYASGYDAETGKPLWLNHPVPRKGAKGDETWGGLPMDKRVHTGVWGALTYDPETGLVYYGSSATAPSSPTTRGAGPWQKSPLAGTNTRYAVKLKTGEVVWSKQLMPGAMWDEECTFEAIIDTVRLQADPKADGMMAIGPRGSSGQVRKVTTGVPCKTGFIYTQDAATGEFLWAKQTVFQNQIQSINAKGAITLNENTILKTVGEPYRVCPGFSGGRNWMPVSYNPDTKIMFIPSINVCVDAVAFTEDGPVSSYQVDQKSLPPPGKEGKAGRIDAVSAQTGQTLWTYEQYAANYNPVMATAGGLVFNGDSARYFRAHDQRTGEVLWKTRLPSEVTGHAISFAVNNRQYVAIEAGETWGATRIGRELSPNVDRQNSGNAIYVFALPTE